MKIYDRWRERRSARKPVTKKDLKEIERKIMALQDELNEVKARVETLTASNLATTQQLVKIQSEIQALIDSKPPPETLPADFLAAITALEESNAALKAQTQVVDDQNPDAPSA